MDFYYVLPKHEGNNFIQVLYYSDTLLHWISRLKIRESLCCYVLHPIKTLVYWRDGKKRRSDCIEMAIIGTTYCVWNKFFFSSPQFFPPVRLHLWPFDSNLSVGHLAAPAEKPRAVTNGNQRLGDSFEMVRNISTDGRAVHFNAASIYKVQLMRQLKGRLRFAKKTRLLHPFSRRDHLYKCYKWNYKERGNTRKGSTGKDEIFSLLCTTFPCRNWAEW